MHQPIPPISIKTAVNNSQAQGRPVGRLRPGVPARVQLTILIAFVVAFAFASLPVFHHPKTDAPVKVGNVVLDPDGDDPRTELLYHWQDPRFAQEERHQIAWMVNGLALIGIYFLTKRVVREEAK